MNCKHGLELEWCALCSPSSNKNRAGKYSFVESSYNGNPVVEILKDGEPFPHDAHFRFGCGKARLIVACRNLIEEFAFNTTDSGFTTVKPQTLHARWDGYDINVSIELHPEFVHSSGITIHRPWLSLRVMPAGNPHISFGVGKAHALYALCDKIEAWARQQCT